MQILSPFQTKQIFILKYKGQMIERKYEDNHKNEDTPIMKMNLIMKTISKKEDSPKNEEICKKEKDGSQG